MKKVVFTTLYLGKKPHPKFVSSLERCLPYIEELGWSHEVAIEENNPYISAARCKLIRKALDANPTAIVFLDYDVSWTPKSMGRLLEAEGDVVAGTYRFKTPKERYMGALETGHTGRPLRRESDGALLAYCAPAGFLKVTPKAINEFAKKHPHLLFGPPMNPNLDMFNHGVIDGIWYGEDYAFCKRWKETGGDLWLLPDLDIDHSTGDVTFCGNFHNYLLNYNGEDDEETEEETF